MGTKLHSVYSDALFWYFRYNMCEQVLQLFRFRVCVLISLYVINQSLLKEELDSVRGGQDLVFSVTF